jgi:hypothetical protein
VLEQDARGERAQGRDGTTEGGPEGDGLGAARARRPQRGDEGQRRRIGHARRDAPEDPGEDEDFDVGGVGRDEACRDGQDDAAEAQQLAPVTIADRPEIQHRRGKAEGVADRGEVQGGLRCVECSTDLGERHIGDREVEVGDRGHEDEGEQHEP